MTFVAFGINHKTAPIEIRERIAPSPEQKETLLLELVNQPNVHGAVLLSTCNRTEIYCDTDQATHLLPWFAEQQALPYSILNKHSYVHKADESIRHMMRVACGLDSMVLGEPQILGQMKQAYQQAHHIGTLNPPLQKLFHHVFNASKKVRTQTNIGAYPVSIAFTAVHFIRKVFPKLSSAQVLLIGSGDTTTLVAKYLQNQGVRHFYVASRTSENANKLAAPLSAHSLSISQIPEYLVKADIVISATQCPLPFIGKEMVHQAQQERPNKPLYMFDLAIPRDVESDVNELDSVFLYNIDDLQELAKEGLEERQLAAFSAEKIIECELDNYLRHEREKQAKEAIMHYRHYAKKIQTKELSRAYQQLSKGLPPEKILEEIAHRLTKKLLHRPTLRLRNAASEERQDLLEHITYLYDQTVTTKKTRPTQ